MQTILVPLIEKHTIAVYSHDDVEAILDHNKKLRSIEQKSDWGRHVATIPNIICVQWLNEAWQRGNEIRYLSPDWDKLVEKKLRDPQWAYLRTDAPTSFVGWQK